MNYALKDQKKSGGSFRVLRLQKRKKRKKSQRGTASSADDSLYLTLSNFAKSMLEWFTKLLLAGALVYGGVQGYQFVTTSTQFEISKVTLLGQQTLQEKELRTWLGSVTGKNIFLLNLEDLSSKLVRHPWVQSVSVRKVFPQDIEVVVTEKKPYARVKLDEIYVMDNFRHLLSPETEAYRHLPLIIQPWSGGKPKLGEQAALKGVIESLKNMQFLNEMPFFANNPITISEIDEFSRVIFKTKDGELKVFASLETIDQDIKDFQVILETLEKDKNNIAYIDLSFKDRVIVQKKSRS
jgi:cell division septal protein FtsQ